MKPFYRVAGIDVHKSMLAVVVGVADQPEKDWERRKFGTTVSELKHLAAWLQEGGVQKVVMESTAMYWRPVWIVLEPHFSLELAQAQSNRAP
ncbi:MAG: transposase, partial [Acidobacteriota bacterium]